MGYKNHLRVDDTRKQLGGCQGTCNNINGMEGFWSYAKTRLAHFHGANPDSFIIYLK